MTQQQYDEYLEHLRNEHLQLDKAISILEMDPQKYYDAISELKKKKLKLKDEIEGFKSQLIWNYAYWVIHTSVLEVIR